MFHKMASPLFSADWGLLCTEDTLWGGNIIKQNIYPSIKDIRDSTPLPKENTVITEERYVLKCGYFPCVQLDWDFTFKRCVGCKLRRYCSPKCYKLDNKFHKEWCFIRPGQDTEEG